MPRRNPSQLGRFTILALTTALLLACGKSDPPAESVSVQPPPPAPASPQPPQASPPTPVVPPPPPPPPPPPVVQPPVATEPASAEAMAEFEAIWKEYVETYQPLPGIMASVKDTTSAQAASQRLKDIAAKTSALAQRRKQLGAIPPSQSRPVLEEAAGLLVDLVLKTQGASVSLCSKPELQDVLLPSFEEVTAASNAFEALDKELLDELRLAALSRPRPDPTESLAELWKYEANKDRIAFSGDGKILFTSSPSRSSNHTYHEAVWDVSTGEKLGAWDSHFRRADFQLSHDGKQLIAIGAVLTPQTGVNAVGHEVRIIELPSGKVRATGKLPQEGFSVAVGLMPNGKLYAIHSGVRGSPGGTFEVDPQTGQMKKLSDQAPRTATFLPEGGKLLTMMDMPRGFRNELLVFDSVEDFVQGKAKHNLGEYRMQSEIIPSHDERYVLVRHRVPGGEIGLLVLSWFDLETGAKVAEIRPEDDSVGAIVLTRDNNYAVTASDKLIRFNLQDKSVTRYDESLDPTGVTPGGAVVVVGFNQPFQYIDPATGERLEVPLDPKWLSAGGSAVASSGSDSGELWKELGNGGVSVLAIASGNPIIVTAAEEFSPKGTRRTVWDMKSGRALGTWQDNLDHYNRGKAILSADGTILLSYGEMADDGDETNYAIAWQLPEGKVLARTALPPDASGIQPFLSADDSHAYFQLSNRNLHSFDLSSGEVRKVADTVGRVTVAPASGAVISGSPPHELGKPFDQKLFVHRSVESFASGAKPTKTIQTPEESAGGGFLSVDEQWLGGKYTKFTGRPGGEKHVIRYNVTTGKIDVDEVFDIGPTLYSMTPDGRYLCGEKLIYDFEGKTPISLESGVRLALTGSVTPGGAVLGWKDEKFVFIDPATGKSLPMPLDEKWVKPAITVDPGGGNTGGNAGVETEPSADKLRTWTSADGKFSVAAEMVKVISPTVHLKTEDGREIQVPIDKLSDEDVKFIKSRR